MSEKEVKEYGDRDIDEVELVFDLDKNKKVYIYFNH